MECTNYVGKLTIKGEWSNTDNIPESLSFTLNLKDGHKFGCSFTKNDPNVITCPIDHVKFKLVYDDQYMDTNQEYLLKELQTNINFDCLSSYICSNLLLLFILIFILLN